MFTGGLKETDMSRVRLQGVSVSSLARIITFIYTGRIHVTEGIMLHKLKDFNYYVIVISSHCLSVTSCSNNVSSLLCDRSVLCFSRTTT